MGNSVAEMNGVTYVTPVGATINFQDQRISLLLFKSIDK